MTNKNIFVACDVSSQKEILDLFGAQKFIKAYDYQYNDIENIGRKLGKIR